MNGSNANTKCLVRAGVLCYVCEKAVPTRRDAYGNICQTCFEDAETALLSIALRDGYVRKGTRMGYTARYAFEEEATEAGDVEARCMTELETTETDLIVAEEEENV